jgi:cytidylate kinase
MDTNDLITQVPTEDDANRCHSYIVCQLEEQKKPLAPGRQRPHPPAITISHQIGSGAHEIAERLAALLQADEPDATVPWTVFDRQLVEKALEEHHLPKALAKYIPEDRRNYIQDVLEEMLGLRPPSWVLEPKIAETVLRLADAGHVILVGRGANFITARLPNVFHVRLIASLPQRIERLQKLNHLTPAAADRLVRDADRAQGRYVKAHFHARPSDDLAYHLIINTDLVSCPDAAQLIAGGARKCFQNGGGAGGEQAASFKPDSLASGKAAK